MSNPRDVAYNPIKDMAKNHHSWGNAEEKSVKAPQKGGLYEISQFDHMNVKVDTLYQNLENLTVASSTHVPITIVTLTTPTGGPYSEVCGVNGHFTRDFQVILVGGDQIMTSVRNTKSSLEKSYFFH
ncbi:unnamed protein product [Lathyrus sativus]|nr:unnamed protein product [Lathyrus sativus]